MRRLKLYEEFRFDDIQTLEPEVELSDKTIDDVLSNDFFEDMEDEGSFIDENGVIHIKNWKVY